jgi:hypothetical protein
MGHHTAPDNPREDQQRDVHIQPHGFDFCRQIPLWMTKALRVII